MEIDFSVAKALASPTRLKILRQLLESENTSTSLSNKLEKSKSTIVNHIEVLDEAGLVDIDKEEGRRRVVYHPTRKAKTIARGGERKVKFSLVSSIVSGAAGLGLLAWGFLQPTSQQAGTLTAEASQTASSSPGYSLILISIVLLIFAILSLLFMSAFWFISKN